MIDLPVFQTDNPQVPQSDHETNCGRSFIKVPDDRENIRQQFDDASSRVDEVDEADKAEQKASQRSPDSLVNGF